MGSKITIIVAGSVGATIAYTLSREPFVSEILMIDVIKDKVDGEAMDIVQGTAFRDPVKVYSGDYCEAEGSDIVIITSGVARKPGQSRIDLAQTNVNIIKSIAPELKKHCPDALYVIVANPVDILTYTAVKLSGLPENRVIGSGTVLDTARLKYALGEHLEVDSRSVHSFIIGEHGDSEIVAWSSTNVSGIPVNDFCELRGHFNHEEAMHRIADDVKNSAYDIIEKKGATYYGIAMSVKRICECIMRDEKSILPISSMMHGEYGISDICLSMPTVVGREGVETRVPIQLNEQEESALSASAEQLSKVAAQLDLAL